MTITVRRASEVTDAGLLVRGAAHGPLVLSLDGHYVWSLTPSRDGQPAAGGVLVPWPHALRPYLHGRAHVRVASVDGSRVLVDEEVTLGTGQGRVAVVDRAGHPLCVDKVGHLTRSFEETADSVRDEVLAGTQRALRDLREHAGVEAYLNYGALLGAVRDGRMLGHDSDTDVCYLSRHTSPADVVLESYLVERVLRERGWRLLRMSGGDIKMLLPLSDGRTCHIDVFVAFYVQGTFFQLGNRSGALAREAILPVSTVVLHGHAFPAPADPEAMLAFVYGPSWRVPDPSFRYADPPAGVRRLDGWLRGFRTDMGRWTEFLQSEWARRIPDRPTPFARWAHRRLPAGDPTVDLGTGTGRDAAFFWRRGRRVLAVDFSRHSVHLAKRRVRRHGGTAEQLILGELRQVLALGARLARDPHHLYARQLLGCLDDAARGQLWLLARMALRGGGQLLLEFSAAAPGQLDPNPRGLVRRLDPDAVRAEIEERGGVIDELTLGPGTDMEEYVDHLVCRMRVSWPRPERNPHVPA